jgi:membrane protease subunit HflC
MNRISAIVVALLVVFGIIGVSIFTVDQRQNAMVFQLGEVKEVITEPGMHFKWPLIQNVRFFDTRILTLDTPDAERFLTSEKKNVLVDSFVKWRIIDVKQYYISMGGDEERAHNRLAQTINAGLREEFGKRTVHEVVSGERDRIMEDMRVKADVDARTFGVQVIDVRLKRVDLPQEVSESVYRRMEAERKRVANELRSTGSAEAEKIRADAERQREVILAEAYRDAQRTKGEGDAKSTAIYAQAFGQNPEFYSFYRSLDAYRQAFRSKSDVLVVEPNSEFFKYLKSSGKAGK